MRSPCPHASRGSTSWVHLPELPSQARSSDEGERFQELLDWITAFITAPHASLPRSGAVCPFVQPALQRDTVWVRLARDVGDDLNRLHDVLQCEANRFASHPPSSEDPNHVFKALLLCFPDLPDKNAGVLKTLRRQAKADLLAMGLTCGEFYPGNPDRSVHTDALLVADSPVPFLALRPLARHDQLFLKGTPLYSHYQTWRARRATGEAPS